MTDISERKTQEIIFCSIAISSLQETSPATLQAHSVWSDVIVGDFDSVSVVASLVIGFVAHGDEAQLSSASADGAADLAQLDSE